MSKSYYDTYKHQLIRKVVDKELDAFALIDILIHMMEEHNLKGEDLNDQSTDQD